MPQCVVIAHRGQDVEAGDAGHHEIEQQNVGALGAQQRDGLSWLSRRDEVLVPRFFQEGLQDLDGQRFIVDDHDLGLGHVLIAASLEGPKPHLLTAARSWAGTLAPPATSLLSTV